MPVRWRIIVEYDGTEYCGWQAQPQGRSIQQTLQAAVESLLAHETHVAASGRTDAGVHAWGQICTFDTTATRTAVEICRGLNALLPDDIACIEAQTMPLDYDPRRCVREKRYRYTWFDRAERSPLRRRQTWHVQDRLDEMAMHLAVQALVGRHDYTSFRASGCSALHAVRTIQAASVERVGDEVRLDIVGNGFLRHMVRIIAGTLHPIGQGRQPPEWMATVRDGLDRTLAGRTAPARGLALVDVTPGPRRTDQTS